jgi:hypothetical protein
MPVLNPVEAATTSDLATSFAALFASMFAALFSGK